MNKLIILLLIILIAYIAYEVRRCRIILDRMEKGTSRPPSWWGDDDDKPAPLLG